MSDPEGYPGCNPPWGTLNCLDLNTGKLVWKVPLGEYPELTAKGVPKTGTENFGGAMVTAGGLVFCSGTRDNKIRAFDAETGAELWSAVLPLHGTAPPASYEAGGGNSSSCRPPAGANSAARRRCLGRVCAAGGVEVPADFPKRLHSSSRRTTPFAIFERGTSQACD